MREILERLVVEREQLRRLARLGLVTGIGAVGDEAARQRRRLVEGIGRRQAEPGDQHAVKTAAAILHRAAVPFDGQIDLEFDRRRLGIAGSIWPSTLQNAGLAGAMRPDGVGPRSATASGDAVCNVAASILTASVPPARPLQTVSASSANVAANAPVAPSAAVVPTIHAHSLALVKVIASTRLSRF